MTTRHGTHLRRGGFVTAAVIAILLVLFRTVDMSATPRPPVPPYPEQPPLYYEGFDEYYFAGETNSELFVPGWGNLHESWSGYALQQTEVAIPFIVPAPDPSGNTNVTCDVGASLRFWITPYWSSGSIIMARSMCPQGLAT
jgi:hypothetical protein